MSDETFLWHDYETFGANARRDRPCQFAALTTNAALEVVGEPQVFYCQPSDDLLPQPGACLITGITPQIALQRGLPEPEFAARIHALMSQPRTCTVGYNNFRFDDEVTRHLFWRTFHDPYSREYANGNSRFDLIDLMRMTRALRPEGMAWANRDDGLPSFRLEDLAAANGVDTRNAHDALADVEATLTLARLLRTQQPRLWHWALSLRDKHTVDGLLAAGNPVLYTGSGLPLAHCATGIVSPLQRHPTLQNRWLVWPLAADPQPFMAMDDTTLAATLGHEDPAQRLPMRTVANNRCPMLAPLTVLDDAAHERLAIDPDAQDHHQRWLNDHPEFTARLARLISHRPPDNAAADPEQALYAGFVARDDQQLTPTVRRLDGAGLADLGLPFRDERLNTLLQRYRARWHRDSLSAEEQAEWSAWRQAQLVDSGALQQYLQQVDELAQQHPDQGELITALRQWPKAIALT
jgi:exodeoxyribonuclease-1